MSKALRNLTIGALATTALAGLAMVPVVANAGNNKDQAAEASKPGKANPNLQLSQDGYNVMRNIRAARVAIFNGDTEAAANFVDLAQKDLAKTKAEDKVVKVKDGNDAGNWIPIDGQLVVADDFVATPEKTKHIAAGNQKIKEGKADEAVQELKLANVDIGFTRLLMPLGETQAHVKTAAKLIASEDYYQANMALKAAEDGVNIDTVILVNAPKPDQQKVGKADQSTTDQGQAKTATD